MSVRLLVCYVGIGNPSVDVREQALKQYITKPAISIKRMWHSLCFFKRGILYTIFSFLLIYVLLVFGVGVFSTLGFGAVVWGHLGFLGMGLFIWTWTKSNKPGKKLCITSAHWKVVYYFLKEVVKRCIFLIGLSLNAQSFLPAITPRRFSRLTAMRSGTTLPPSYFFSYNLSKGRK